MKSALIGHNGFKYNYRGVAKTRYKYYAHYYDKNPAKSCSPRIKKHLGTYAYATEAAKSHDDYLIATNGDKRKLNFASESEYLLALDEEKNTNLLALKKNSIDVDDTDANSTSKRISSTKPLVFDNNDILCFFNFFQNQSFAASPSGHPFFLCKRQLLYGFPPIVSNV